MTSGAPWSVKGIDPKAREVAKDLARRSGMTLGEWLNQTILQDDGPDEITSESFFSDRPSRPTSKSARAAEPAPVSERQVEAQRMRAPEHPGDYVERMAGLLERLTTRIETAEARTGQAVSGVEQSVRSALSRIEAAERAQVDSAEHIEGEVEVAKVAQAELDERLRKMEEQVAGPRPSEALRALEGAISKIAGQVYEGESRTHDILAEVEARIAKIEEAGPDARLIEEVVSRVGERLSQAESRTHEAIEGLRQSLAALDGRLNSVEDESGLDSKLEALGARLAGSLEEARAEIAEKFASSADGRYERMERTLDEMSEHVRAAEERSAHAIEQMGREVLNVAEVMNKRIQSAETRNAEAIEKAGGEMARVVQAMETRFSRSDAVHVEALEKLSAEISRITERLGERIASAERRSAQAFDEVGEQVSRVAERINHRAEKASEDLAERIRQSEERTARLLDEARDRIGQRLSETQAPDKRVSDAGPAAPGLAAGIASSSGGAAPIALAPAVYETSTFPAREEPEAFSDDPFAGFPEVESAEAPPESASAFMARAFPAAAEKPPTLTAPPAAEEPEDAPVAPAVEEPQSAASPVASQDATNPFARLEAALQASEESQAAFEAADPFADPAEDQRVAEAATLEPGVFEDEGPRAPDFDASFTAAADETQDEGASLSADDALFDAPPSEPAAAGDSTRPLTTREVVEQARAAARAAAQNGDAKGKLGKPGARNKAAAAPLFSGFGLSRPKRRAGGTLQTFLMVSGGAAFLGLAAGGVAMMAGKPSGETPPRIAQAKAIAEQDGTPVDGPEKDGLAAAPRASVALAPEPMAATEADVRMLTPEMAAPDLSALYAEAVRALEAGENGALAELKKAANLGHAPAQLYLGKLYEDGRSGVKADLAEARRWTERAAEGGDRRAMHNIALYYFNGEGGPKNPVSAAQWFRRAADLGLVDSQYNLGRLYEEGLGVGQNSAEAYKWYLIAARAGDAEARVAARRVKPSLSVEAQSVAERAAVAFRTTAPASTGLAASSSPVLTAQRALSKLGYYQGPTNGAPTPALRLAISAYQRDQGLAATGTLDNTTVSRLAVFTR